MVWSSMCATNARLTGEDALSAPLAATWPTHAVKDAIRARPTSGSEVSIFSAAAHKGARPLLGRATAEVAPPAPQGRAGFIAGTRERIFAMLFLVALDLRPSWHYQY
jgi:hypothetical protein